MSNPVSRLSHTDQISAYAPKGVRGLEVVGIRQSLAPQRFQLGDEIVTAEPEDIRGEESFRVPKCLEPVVMPDPPRASLLRILAQNFVKSGRVAGGYYVFLLAMCLTAVVAFVLVMQVPKSESPTPANAIAMQFQALGPKPAPWSPGAKLTRTDADNTPSAYFKTMTAVSLGPTVPGNVLLPWPKDSSSNTPSADPSIGETASASVAAVQPQQDKQPLGTDSTPAAKTTAINSDEPPRSRPLTGEQIEILLKQGKDFVSVGDFASARIVFRRIAEARDARGALELAATYDPVVLGYSGAKGATPDVRRASEWYIKARELGSLDASVRLQALAGQ